ncbi:MAG: thioredoxin domain-containing protein [Solirubrobacterales bacterium]|nr:thioredoxin domain-containing protein [Solirubrobacterales bacterium]MCB8969605.1 thioredoxin domain-containing protein [Thermoleophilales bacterium]MCO5327394.1 thioredoxin domain-containing protein [Solirubrobacterales bacterium]
MANRLADETSPYLLQHRDNPVDWLPWGAEARGLARDRDVPLLVSIGYSACHWCHVMERESFEDPETAAYMNEHFVPVKVDREERPDVDAIYMEAVQGMTGHGGWPLTAFCDPDGVPFHCGTYFPPEPRQGMPSFRMVLEAVNEAWSAQREEIDAAADRTRSQLGSIGRIEPTVDDVDTAIASDAATALLDRLDPVNGGFGGAPKFPPASALDLLLAQGGEREHDAVRLTLDAMAAGGIHDQLGGGFARYAVDSRWLVPHFEKMLYDNALLARTYLRAWKELGEERYRDVATGILDWALAEMRGPEGGFHSALDADSEGEEGRFYTWTMHEVDEALEAAGLAELGPDVRRHYGVTPAGHLEGRSVLHLANGIDGPQPDGLEAARRALLDARAERVRPGLDDKRLTAWNALMAGALAEAGAALDEPRYLDAATACLSFLLGTMRGEDGRLLRTYNRDRAHLNGYLEDHSYLLEALLDAYEATFEERWYEAAREIAEAMIARFGDPDNGGFFTTSDDHEELIARRKDLEDHPTPSGNSAAANGLLRLAALSGEATYESWAAGVVKLLAPTASRHPQAFAHLLAAADRLVSPAVEVALIAPAGDPDATDGIAATYRSRFRPRSVLAGGAEGSSTPPLLADRPALDGGPAAYVCERFACKAPVGSAEELRALIDA